MLNNNKTDYLIIGAGIIGLNIARELRTQFPKASITILEKEIDVAYHSSGRNSGVLHAGFYYTANSLKARFTRDGNKAMKEYCNQNQIQINDCKKVVVAKNESELTALFELEKRGAKNGVEVKIIDEKELAEIDSNVKTYQYALFSPSTVTVNPIDVNYSIKNELKEKGVVFRFGEAYISRLDDNTITTSNNNIIYAGKIVNTAGLYADKIAKDFNFSDKYTIIPFKGIYLKYKGDNKPVSTNVYPVPNLKNPFLGVHYTVTADGTVKIGPTSIPAFWRENYRAFHRFSIKEAGEILSWNSRLFFTNAFGFRTLALEEVKKYRRKHFTNMASKLVHKLDADGFKEWGKPGIRAQLLNIKTKELVMDFVVEGDDNSVHILNAVSPAFTCSIPFSKWVVKNYITK